MTNPRETRGQILAVLAAAYPTPLSDVRMQRTLDNIEFDTPRSVLRSNLEYLRDSGFVELEEDYADELGGDFLHVRLTGKGLRLIRGEREPDALIDPRGYAHAATLPRIRRRG